jgi:Fe-S cluster assembly protein SufD
MTELMRENLARAQTEAPAWWDAAREDARRRWESTSLPTRKTEAWKYTDVRALDRSFAPGRPVALDDDALADRIPDLDGPRLVFVNGHYAPALSSAETPAGLRVCRFSEADESRSARIREALDSVVDADRHLFAALNSAALCDGVLVEVEAGATLHAPLQVVWVCADQGEAFAANQRLLVLAGENSCASVVESFVSLAEDSSFTNGVSELLLSRGATLNHYRLQLEGGAALHVGGVHARLARDATLNSFHLGLGSDLKRVDIVVEHAGEGAHAEVNGLYLPRGREHVDYHTCMEHAVPHCSSTETFRGLVADAATAVFNGRIHIHPRAQKTSAELSNKNLLTSAEAQVNTKPELEIYADDVQCAHGATVAQLDALSLHYLRTRGIGEAQARLLLSIGFVNALVAQVRDERLREYLQRLLEARLLPESGAEGDA